MPSSLANLGIGYRGGQRATGKITHLDMRTPDPATRVWSGGKRRHATPKALLNSTQLNSFYLATAQVRTSTSTYAVVRPLAGEALRDIPHAGVPLCSCGFGGVTTPGHPHSPSQSRPLSARPPPLRHARRVSPPSAQEPKSLKNRALRAKVGRNETGKVKIRPLMTPKAKNPPK